MMLTAEPRDAVVDQFLVVGVFADIGFERFHACSVASCFLFDLVGGLFRFVIIEDHVRTGLRK